MSLFLGFFSCNKTEIIDASSQPMIPDDSPIEVSMKSGGIQILLAVSSSRMLSIACVLRFSNSNLKSLQITFSVNLALKLRSSSCTLEIDNKVSPTKTSSPPPLTVWLIGGLLVYDSFKVRILQVFSSLPSSQFFVPSHLFDSLTHLPVSQVNWRIGSHC